MKKRFFPVALAITLSGSVLFTSCIGSFSLFNKLLAWNQTIDNKFVNELVFFALWVVPAYEVAMLADVLVLNSIEFWSGSNPVEAGIINKVQGENGIYTVETLENGYHIQNEDGNAMDLIYDKATNTWNAVANGTETKLVKLVDEQSAIVYLPNGEERNVELSANGMLAFRQAMSSSVYFAAK